MIGEEQLYNLALIMCMKTGHRYLECLNYVAVQNQMFLDKKLLKQVRDEFLGYRSKMKAARFSVNLDILVITDVDDARV